MNAQAPFADLADLAQLRETYKHDKAVVLNTLANSWWGKAAIGLEYLLHRTGPMSMAPSQLGAFTRSDSTQPHPNLEYHVQPLSLDAFGEPLHSFPAITASVCNLNPTSRGTVQIKSARFEDAPAIAPNYLSTDADRKVAADSLRVTRRILAQSALAAYMPQEHKPGVQFQSDEELAKLAGDGRIATGDVKAVPVGKYAKAALEKLGAWQAAEPKFAMAESVRAALTLVARGEAVLGIVYSTDAKVEPGVKVVGTFPADTHPAIIYPVAATTTAKPETSDYLVFLRSSAAKTILEKYGFKFLISPTT